MVKCSGDITALAYTILWPRQQMRTFGTSSSSSSSSSSSLGWEWRHAVTKWSALYWERVDDLQFSGRPASVTVFRSTLSYKLILIQSKVYSTFYVRNEEQWSYWPSITFISSSDRASSSGWRNKRCWLRIASSNSVPSNSGARRRQFEKSKTQSLFLKSILHVPINVAAIDYFASRLVVDYLID